MGDSYRRAAPAQPVAFEVESAQRRGHCSQRVESAEQVARVSGFCDLSRAHGPAGDGLLFQHQDRPARIGEKVRRYESVWAGANHDGVDISRHENRLPDRRRPNRLTIDGYGKPVYNPTDGTRRMAVDEIHVAAAPARVFAVLSDRRRYGDWVVGTERTVEGEGDWPQPGSSLIYRTAGPIALSNRTIVRGVVAPSRLELRAKAGPMPDVDITLDLLEEGDGTLVRMHERPTSKAVNWLMLPIGHSLLSRRNRVALDRLRRIAESDGG